VWIRAESGHVYRIRYTRLALPTIVVDIFLFFRGALRFRPFVLGGTGRKKNEKPIKTDRQDRLDRRVDFSTPFICFFHNLFLFCLFFFSNKNIDTLIGFACTRTSEGRLWVLNVFADRKGGGEEIAATARKVKSRGRYAYACIAFPTRIYAHFAILSPIFD
jgi:hypothetical protein